MVSSLKSTLDIKPPIPFLFNIKSTDFSGRAKFKKQGLNFLD
jgi:hypothetical protein